MNNFCKTAILMRWSTTCMVLYSKENASTLYLDVLVLPVEWMSKSIKVIISSRRWTQSDLDMHNFHLQRFRCRWCWSYSAAEDYKNFWWQYPYVQAKMQNWEEIALRKLRTHFGHKYLKCFQREALKAWASNRDCFVLAASGSGTLEAYLHSILLCAILWQKVNAEASA